MYCLLEIKSASMREPHWIEKEQYYKILQIKTKANDLLDAVELLSFFTEAYEDLTSWCMNANINAEYLMNNKHTAERKCRSVLLELKTYFLQMEKKLENKYGDQSKIYKLFTDAKDKAKRTDELFMFVMDLKECANHCNEIIHTFLSPSPKEYVQPCCIPAHLLTDYDSWSKTSRKYLTSLTGNIDLLDIFEYVCDVIKRIQKDLINQLLEKDSLTDSLLELRRFMDGHFTKENCLNFHLAHMVYQNGKDAPKVSFYQKKVTVEFNAHLIDWKVVYELTDLLAQ